MSSPLSVIALILGGLSFIILPIIFGPIAIILAVIGKKKGESLANVALTVGILGTVIGMIIGAVVGANMLG